MTSRSRFPSWLVAVLNAEDKKAEKGGGAAKWSEEGFTIIRPKDFMGLMKAFMTA